MKFININNKIHKIFSFWIAEKRTLKHLEDIRKYELGVVFKLLPPIGKILEIGAGTGWQAQALTKRGYEVSAIDLLSSNYKENRIWPVTEYDGVHIPFPDKTFDIVFSSNTLEHIPHVHNFQKEIHRVLKDDGVAIHILPSGSWRFWSNITDVLRYWEKPPVHGEFASNFLTEIFFFSKLWWKKLFLKTIDYN